MPAMCARAVLYPVQPVAALGPGPSATRDQLTMHLEYALGQTQKAYDGDAFSIKRNSFGCRSIQTFLLLLVACLT
jgi:hypothetical protein